MLKILTADDHAVVRVGVRQILSESKDIHDVAEAGTAAETVRKASLGHFDVILLDVSLPDKNGLEVLKILRQQNPDQAVLMLSMHPEEQYAIRALKAGARGYLTKESAPVELVSAVHKVSQGGRYISVEMAEKLAFHLAQDQQQMPHQLLSDREYQVMLMIAGGKTVSQIADELGLSVKTISTNRVRALQKMAMRHNAEFTYYAVKEGLVS
jgi:DNA-binding NarL/FixJ family response regulator